MLAGLVHAPRFFLPATRLFLAGPIHRLPQWEMRRPVRMSMTFFENVRALVWQRTFNTKGTKNASRRELALFVRARRAPLDCVRP